VRCLRVAGRGAVGNVSLNVSGDQSARIEVSWLVETVMLTGRAMSNPCSFRVIAREQTQGLGAVRQRKHGTQSCLQLSGANDRPAVDCGQFGELSTYLVFEMKAPPCGRCVQKAVRKPDTLRVYVAPVSESRSVVRQNAKR